MCCNSGEDLEVFAPSYNSPHKYTRWNLKISRNFCFCFLFFFSKVPGISVFQKRLNCVAAAKQAGGEEGRGGGEKRERER